MSDSKYMIGHHESVLKSHNWRTAQNSAAYLLPSLTPDMHILDVGCGPGAITAGLAALVSGGQVIGMDNSVDVIEKARSNASTRGVTNVRFVVLQHVIDPVKALQEMRRVTKPGGIVAAREGDFVNQAWYPENQVLDAFTKLWVDRAHALGLEPLAGRRLVSWAMKAGFSRLNITASASAWCYSLPEERVWWANVSVARLNTSPFAKTAVEMGYTTEERLKQTADAFLEWATQEDGWYSFVSGEIICRV